MLISRTWHGSVPIEHGDAFAVYLEKTGIQESLSIPGNAAAYVHRVEQDDHSHFFLCTLWSSWEAVRAFAGETPEIAVTYPEDAKYDLISDPIVIHQEVNTDQNPFARFHHSGGPSKAAHLPDAEFRPCDMVKPISNLTLLLQSMEPTLHSGVYVYCSVPHDTDLRAVTALATIREAEGITIVLPVAEALEAGFPVMFRAAWITLSVHSDLQAVGLTAAFALSLGSAGISCNVMAGAYHDHIFVPVEHAQAAMAALRALQLRASQK